MSIHSSEDIAKAICSDNWDGERYGSSLFKGQNSSVSLLSITTLEDSWDLFQRKVEKPPTRTLEQIGVINIGRMQEVAAKHITKAKLTVVHKPLPDYESHAEIPEKISKGLANEIIRNLEIHELPEEFRKKKISQRIS